MDKYYLAILQNIPELSEAPLEGLLEHFVTGESIWRATDEELKCSHLLTDIQVQALLAFRLEHPDYPHKLAEQCQKLHLSLCTITEKEYPPLLKEAYNPPLVLFYRGKLQNACPRIAMVGSRKITSYGRAVAEKFSVSLAGQGFCIVSGGAYGVDTESHRGALSTGVTEAVLGCGLDISYPAANRKLLAEITEKGAVISEYLPGTPPLKHHFPARNRIIAGMSLGVLVVEAAQRSGSLITAKLGLEFGRDIFAVPASIFADGSIGSNQLIQQGAKPVLDSEDIIIEYRGKIKLKTLSQKNGKMEKDCALSREEREIYSLLRPDIPMSIDDIIFQLPTASPAQLSVILLQLEIKGLVRSDKTHMYVRK